MCVGGCVCVGGRVVSQILDESLVIVHMEHEKPKTKFYQILVEGVVSLAVDL